MARSLMYAGALLALTTYVQAQYGAPDGNSFGGDFSSDNNPYSGGSDSSDNGGSNNSGGSANFDNSNFGGDSNRFGGADAAFFAQSSSLITAHAVLATVAFAFLFPLGGILIRLGSFRGLWLAHGVLQMVAYVFYIAAVGIGLYLATNVRMLSEAHPIIGLALLVVLFFQPFLGLMHHLLFKRHDRRMVWSYGHIWLGRVAITIGIINGGLGLKWASPSPYAPSQAQIIGYSVVAAVMWVAYVIAAVFGERKRGKAQKTAVTDSEREKDTARSASSGEEPVSGGGKDGVRYA